MLEKYVNYFKNNQYAGEDLLLDVSFEHFVVKKDTFDEVAFEGKNGIREALEKLAELGWEGSFESAEKASLKKENAELTLGKGNQLTYSMKNFNSIHDLNNEYLNFLDEVFPVLEEQGNMLLAIGYHPTSKGKSVKESTASITFSLTYLDQFDFRKKFQVFSGLQPLLSAMFENSPIYEGEINEDLSLREKTYDDFVKNSANVLDRDYDYKLYSSHLLNLANKLGIESKEIEGINDSINAQITVDEKINLNAIDSVPYPLNVAYVAMMKGLMLNKENLDALFEFVNALTLGCLTTVKEDVQKESLEAKFGDGLLKDLGRDIMFMANTTLEVDEQKYLKTIDPILYQGVVPKQITLKQFKK